MSSQDYIQFSLKEYESLRAETRDAVQESRVVERQATIACGAIWAWVLTQPGGKLVIDLAKYLPLAISLLGAIRSIALHVRLVRLTAYSRIQEQKFGRGFYFSWESSLSKKSWLLTGTSAVFWVALIAGNCLGIFAFMRLA